MDTKLRAKNFSIWKENLRRENYKLGRMTKEKIFESKMEHKRKIDKGDRYQISTKGNQPGVET